MSSQAPPQSRPGVWRDRLVPVVVVLLAFGFYAWWAFAIPYDSAPDEAMRYQIVRYMVDYGALPVGSDPLLRDEIWGTSYAFQPFLAYMVGAVFAKFALVSGWDLFQQLVAARFASVLFGVGTVIVSIVLSRRLFTGPWRWVFVGFVALLPQFAFLNSYVNSDSLGLFASSLLVLAWVQGLKDGWTIPNTILLSVGLSVCALSYYNAYGFVLGSVLVFFLERFLAWRGREQDFWRRTLTRVALILAICAALAGWFFVRNAMLYDGDFLGLRTSDYYGQMYGKAWAKPGASSAIGHGWNLAGMLIGEKWIGRTVQSSIGFFGYMKIPLPLVSYVWHLALWLAGAVGLVLSYARKVLPRRRTWLRPVGESAVMPGLEGGRRLSMQATLALGVVIPWVLSFYFSYTQDYQPQGRYVLPMLIPFAFFITRGLAWVIERAIPSGRGRSLAAAVMIAGWAAIAFHALVWLVIPYYYG